MKCAREFAYYKSTGELERDVKDYIDKEDYISNTYSSTRIHAKRKVYQGQLMIQKSKQMTKKTVKDQTDGLKGRKLKLKYQNILLHAKLKRLKNKVAITKHNQRIIDNLEESLIPGTGLLYLEAKLHFEHLCTLFNQKSTNQSTATL